uniref:Uncharacterized protein n=1 Tax=Peronospora matthiolae TaxID=2874970 RepID=A0AAV1TYU3_9STRA
MLPSFINRVSLAPGMVIHSCIQAIGLTAADVVTTRFCVAKKTREGGRKREERRKRRETQQLVMRSSCGGRAKPGRSPRFQPMSGAHCPTKTKSELKQQTTRRLSGTRTSRSRAARALIVFPFLSPSLSLLVV